ncbi:MAG: YceD family protein [Actinomycetota bacterium]|nr:YceD family protein [Actinomycetota bacterium]
MDKKSQTRPDPRKPLIVDTRDLGRRAGSMRKLHRRVPAPERLGIDVVGVPEGAELDLDLRLEAVMEGVLVSADVRAPLAGECSRCLEPLESVLEVDFQELFAYEESSTDETTDEDETRRLDGEFLDLEPALRDAVVLALPLTPHCREDCPGLCPGCGVKWDKLDEGHSHEVVDSRWAALQALSAPDSPPGQN